jgi:hypothetical protein
MMFINVFRTVEDFKEPGVPLEVAELRLNHYNKKRGDKI